MDNSNIFLLDGLSTIKFGLDLLTCFKSKNLWKKSQSQSAVKIRIVNYDQNWGLAIKLWLESGFYS